MVSIYKVTGPYGHGINMAWLYFGPSEKKSLIQTCFLHKTTVNPVTPLMQSDSLMLLVTKLAEFLCTFRTLWKINVKAELQ